MSTLEAAFMDGDVDEQLYHVVRSFVEYDDDEKSEPMYTDDIRGSWTSLSAAKTAARNCIKALDFDLSAFSIYETNEDPELWKHGDGVMVYAKTTAGHEIFGRLYTTLNMIKVKGNDKGKIDQTLYYVLQEHVDYNAGRTGGKREIELEGAYLSKKDADVVAYETLINDENKKEWFKMFKKYEEMDEENGEWIYGSKILVHAVDVNGDKFSVMVLKMSKPQDETG